MDGDIPETVNCVEHVRESRYENTLRKWFGILRNFQKDLAGQGAQRHKTSRQGSETPKHKAGCFSILSSRFGLV